MPVKLAGPVTDTLYFDFETDNPNGPYATINLIGFQLNDEPVKICKYGSGKPRDIATEKEFRQHLKNPRIRKVGFNIVNFDDQVAMNHDMEIAGPIDDLFFMAKTLYPAHPAYSMKLLCLTELHDMHWAEGVVEEYKRRFGVTDWSAIPDKILIPYLEHDMWQTKSLHKHFVTLLADTPAGQNAYNRVEIRGAYHLPRMIYNGIYVDTDFCSNRLATLQEEKHRIADKAQRKFSVTNLLSTKQVGEVLDLDGFHIALTESDHYSLDKRELVDLKDKSPLAQLVYEAREIQAVKGFMENFLEAAKVGKPYPSSNLVCIPTAFSQSAARSRRFISGSFFGINFQNLSQKAKEGIGVPPGWIECQIDLTAIEEVIHIFYSDDTTRRKLYEADEKYSSYVTLCNLFHGTTKTKDEWDNIQFDANPVWSIYKAFKTAKLAANFSMGARKFAATHRCSLEVAQSILSSLHEAQPAIKQLVRDITAKLQKRGVVYDPFGHAYSGPIDKAYKVVAYMIQGTAASLLKMILWDILAIQDRFPRQFKGCATVHDSIVFRMHKSLGLSTILEILDECRYISTEKYSSYFDDIPLRSKPALSTTNWAAFKTQEFNWKDLEAQQPLKLAA